MREHAQMSRKIYTDRSFVPSLINTCVSGLGNLAENYHEFNAAKIHSHMSVSPSFSQIQHLVS